MSVTTGPGDLRVAHDLYRSAILREVAIMRREGIYVCMANVTTRMPNHNQEILWEALWMLALEGELA
jgi:hypothetical protein